MYKKKEESLTIASVLAKLEGKAITAYTPIVYTEREISRARSVLDRLLEESKKSEVSSIVPKRKQIDE